MPNLLPSLRPALILNQGSFPPPALPGFPGTTGLSATPPRPASPSRAAGWSHARPRDGASRVASASLFHACCRHYPDGIAGALFARFTSNDSLPRNKAGSASVLQFSRPAQRSLTLRPACSPSRLATLYIEGFSHFVTSIAAPIATGWSESSRVGFAPTGKAPTLHGARRTRVASEIGRAHV